MRLKPVFINGAYLFLKYTLLLLILLLILGISSLIFSWKDWQNFGTEALAGRQHLELGVQALSDKNWQLAENKFLKAQNNFSRSGEAVESLRKTWFPARIKTGAKELNNLNNLNDSAFIIARSALQVSRLAYNINPLNQNHEATFTDLKQEEKAAFLQSLIALEPELNGLKANLNLALIKLEAIPRLSILWPLRGHLSELRQQLHEGQELINQSIPILRLAPAFSGYPEEANYLIMFQNNDELRPSGGFLGSYARLDIANFGEIKKLEASDIYHLDMPSIGKTNYEPPAPIAKYLGVENWYLRDANWSPDWPSAARQIQEMFQAQSLAIGNVEPELKGVLAITPDFVANLLGLTGPITVRGESYAPENMQALLQYNVEVAYLDEGISSWDRKDIINELIAELKSRLMNLPLSDYPELIQRLTTSIERKDLLFYFNNPSLQSAAMSLNATGEIKDVKGDYFMVVDANLAAFKSDAVMKKNISYQITENEDKLRSSIKLSYYHGGDFDWRTTRYRSYTRILTPLGSELINIEGLNINEADLINYDDLNLNKRVFGFFWVIEPGRSREISVNYYLPDNIKRDFEKNKEYNLYIQRQAGSRNENLSVAIALNNNFAKIYPKDLDGLILEEKNIYLRTKLEKDFILKAGD